MYASPVSFGCGLLHRCNTRSAWLVRPYSAGLAPRKKTPRFTWRTNACGQPLPEAGAQRTLEAVGSRPYSPRLDTSQAHPIPRPPVLKPGKFADVAVTIVRPCAIQVAASHRSCGPIIMPAAASSATPVHEFGPLPDLLAAGENAPGRLRQRGTLGPNLRLCRPMHPMEQFAGGYDGEKNSSCCRCARCRSRSSRPRSDSTRILASIKTAIDRELPHGRASPVPP